MMLKFLVDLMILQFILLLVYQVVKQTTFFKLNRFFLLFSIVIALTLPFLDINILQLIFKTQTSGFSLEIGQLSEVFLSASENSTRIDTSEETLKPTLYFSWFQVMMVVFLLGILLKLIQLIAKFRAVKTIVKSARLITSNPEFELYQLPNSREAFSFLNCIYIGDQFSETQFDHILSHEKVHVKSRHSLDVIFIELCAVIFWCNPLWYWYKREFELLHEFEADAAVIQLSCKTEYYQSLLSVGFGTTNFRFVNPFFNHSILKKRIHMLQKSNTKAIQKLKYLWLLPALLIGLTYLSCSDTSLDNEVLQKQVNQEEAEFYRAKYQKELAAQLAEGKTIMDIITEEDFNLSMSSGIESKEDFYRYQVYSKKLMESIVEVDNRNTVYEQNKDKLYGMTYEEWLTLESSRKNSSRVNEVVEKVEYSDHANVPFAVIEESPYVESCEGLVTNEETKKCFSQFITNFVSQKAEEMGLMQAANNLGFKGVQRIYVQFKINSFGEVVGVKARAPHADLQQIGEAIVEQLPRMIPGRHKGKNVAVIYSLPITFKIN